MVELEDSPSYTMDMTPGGSPHHPCLSCGEHYWIEVGDIEIGDEEWQCGACGGKRCVPYDAYYRVQTYPRPLLNIVSTPASFESPLEERFWQAYTESGMANSIVLTYQYPVFGGRYRVDFAHVSSKVAIEIDGYEFHIGKEQFTRDRRRQREMELAGWRFVRFSGEEVYWDPRRCVADAIAAIQTWSRQGAA